MNTKPIQHYPEPKAYIGDGAYVRYDGENFILTAENGVEVLHRIVLEPAVWRALQEFAAKVLNPPLPEPTQEISPAVQQILDIHRAKVTEGQQAEQWIIRNGAALSHLASQGITPNAFGGGMDFDWLTHPQVMEVIKAFPGKWEKSVCGTNEPRINYESTFDGKTIRCWAGEPPPSCRIVEEEIEVPATRKTVRRLDCTPSI